MKTLREMIDLVEGNLQIEDAELANLLHTIVVHLIFNKQKISINDSVEDLIGPNGNGPVAREARKAYKMEGLIFDLDDARRAARLLPKVMAKIRRGFAPERN